MCGVGAGVDFTPVHPSYKGMIIKIQPLPHGKIERKDQQRDWDESLCRKLGPIHPASHTSENAFMFPSEHKASQSITIVI